MSATQPDDERFSGTSALTCSQIFSSGITRGFETREEVGPEELKMLAIQRAESGLRHLGAESQPEIAKREGAALREKSVSEFSTGSSRRRKRSRAGGTGPVLRTGGSPDKSKNEKGEMTAPMI